jgi:ABC-2 type transport system ATP-binding protein
MNLKLAHPHTLAIDIDHLVACYGSYRAIDGITLHVPRGSIFSLVGPNGSGKTTMIKTLLGFRRPRSGSIRILGYNSVDNRQDINARIGFMSETNSLYLDMTIEEILCFYRTTAYFWNQRTVDNYRELFGFPAKSRIRNLSKGMQIQLALCLILGSEPELLILDEPMTGIDPIARNMFLKVLAGDIAATGKTVFFSTHILSDVETIADRVAILRSGQIMLDGELDEIKQRHAHVSLSYADALEDSRIRTLRSISGVVHAESEGRTVQVQIEGNIDQILMALHSTFPISVDIKPLTFEEIFLVIMQKGAL